MASTHRLAFEDFTEERGPGLNTAKTVASNGEQMNPLSSVVNRATSSTLDAAGQSFAREALSTLISVAAAALDNDRATAKACLRRAAELLGTSGERRAVHVSDVPRGGLAPWQQRRLMGYIEDHINSTIRISELARVARLSRGHFFRAFFATFGETPLMHVVKLRIDLAQSLMLGSGAPLSQIALDCGMCDQAHFTRVFRRIVGTTPGIWRRRFRPGNARADLEQTSSTAARLPALVERGHVASERHDPGS